MKMKKIICLLLAIVMSTGSVLSQNNNVSVEGAEKHLVSKISFSENGQKAGELFFEYDPYNRLKCYQYTDVTGNDKSYDFEYNDQGILFKYIYKFGSGQEREYMVTYKDEKIIETSFIEDNVAYRNIFRLNEGGLLEKYSEEFDSVDYSYYVWQMFEYDDKGNILKVTYSDDSYTVFTYDDKNGILKDITLPHWLALYVIEMPITPNNLLTKGYSANKYVDSGTMTFTYIYGDDGYPVLYTAANGEYSMYYEIEYKIVK